MRVLACQPLAPLLIIIHWYEQAGALDDCMHQHGQSHVLVAGFTCEMYAVCDVNPVTQF